MVARESVDGICNGFARRVESRAREPYAVDRRLTSGGFGDTVGHQYRARLCALGRGVTDAHLAGSDYRLEAAGREVPARFHAWCSP
jgi:hypothetical protein